ncbi:MAG: S9 family peptidase [Cyclobacteriaceae bacterium]
MQNKYSLILLLFLFLNSAAFAQKSTKPETSLKGLKTPTIDDVLKISRVGWSAVISPDGKSIAYDISTPDFDRDINLNEIWIAEVTTGKSRQLSKAVDDLYDFKWSPDGKWLTCLSGQSNQIVSIPVNGGEPVQLTKAQHGVGYFAWSPDGKHIAYTSPENEPENVKIRKAHSGNFTVVGETPALNCLWTVKVDHAFEESAPAVQLTKNIFITGSGASFSWSPDGSKIAFSGISADKKTDLSPDIYSITLADGSIRQLVSLYGRDRDPQWSPDGKQIIFTSDMGKKGLEAYNYHLATVDLAGGVPVSLTDKFTDNPRLVEWNKDGIYLWAWQKAAAHIFRLDPASRESIRVQTPADLNGGGFSFTADGGKMAFTASSPKSIDEVYLFDLKKSSIQKLTDLNAQVKEYALGKREVITWKNNEDGLEITGVLTKPADFDPKKKYPLMLLIHGGPAQVSYPTLLSWRYYPIDLWVSRGALVLEANYRGSIGHGREFSKIAFRSFIEEGVDIMSGIDHLIKREWVDTTRIACMGWSHGGYLTALLASTSNRFKAVSVGAGVSDWTAFYYSSNGEELGPAYLGANPSTDPEIYRKLSPMSYIKQYRTPTLIQHGEADRTVPISEAYRLRKELDEQKVQVEMIVYNGFGHGINKPRSLRSATEHNFYWFNHFLWGDPLPDFSKPDPVKVNEENNLPQGQ